MAFRIPVELQETARAFDVKKWFSQKTFPKALYFETVDMLSEHLRKVDPDGDLNNKNLATMIACTIAQEGSLERYALATGSEIGSPEKWTQICTAAAWVIMQAYDNATRKGEWPL